MLVVARGPTVLDQARDQQARAAGVRGEGGAVAVEGREVVEGVLDGLAGRGLGPVETVGRALFEGEDRPIAETGEAVAVESA